METALLCHQKDFSYDKHKRASAYTAAGIYFNIQHDRRPK